MKKINQQRGITLVALVITIIILLILAGISISALTGSGLFGKAKDSKLETEIAREKEQIKMSVMSEMTNTEYSNTINFERLKEELENYNDIETVDEVDTIPSGATIVSKINKKFELKDLFITTSYAAEDSKYAKVTYKSKRVYYVEIKGDNIGKIYEDPSNKDNNTTGNKPGESETPADPSLPTNPATTIAEAQSEYMLIKTVNSSIQDAYGNKITIPAGFRIKADATTNDATTVNEGIVIIDSNENEFVWIPVGKIYTDTAKTEANAKTIEINRYTFDDSGNQTAKNDEEINNNYQELETSTYGNITAKNITDFKTKASASRSGGYYIGRYEARKNSSEVITEKGTDNVYNNVSEIQAADLSKNMYGSDKPFTSDLMNSYAWDTAILFLQTFVTNSTPYSIKNSVNADSLAETGTNNQTTQDVQCNVYDMASNVYEWTTETCINDAYPCVNRGGGYLYSSNCTRDRGNYSTSGSVEIGFRPILYL